MNEILLVALAGFLGGLSPAAPTFGRLARDIWRHGFDNHLCHRRCCGG